MKIVKLALFTLFISALSANSAFAQRFAYVDTEYILQHIPEYNAAQKQLDDISIKWQEEIDQRFTEIENLYKKYQEEQVLLSPEMRRQREDEIINLEIETKEFQRLKFGYEGDLFQEKIKLIQPIQERVAKAIQQIAAEQALDIILDKSGEVVFLYANPRLDKSDEVIVKLGYKPDPEMIKN
jgi:outer membrane protein